MKRMLIALTLCLFAMAIISCAAAAPRTQPQTSLGVAPAQPPMPFAPTAAPAATSVAGAGNREALDSSGVPQVATADRMIVYTVQVSLEVQDTEKAVDQITAIVAGYKGYLAAANMSRGSQGLMRGTLTVRIPAESLDAAQKQIEATGLKVLSRNRSSNDVTDQYTDLNARLTNLQATEVELRQMLDSVREKGGKADDILAVYNQLTQIRGQIEQIKGQMNVLEKTTAFATMTIQLTPHEEIQVVEPEGFSPGTTAREALRALVQALQGLATLAIWLVLFLLPAFIVLILPLVIVAFVLRAVLRRRGVRKAVVTQ